MTTSNGHVSANHSRTCLLEVVFSRAKSCRIRKKMHICSSFLLTSAGIAPNQNAAAFIVSFTDISVIYSLQLYSCASLQSMPGQWRRCPTFFHRTTSQGLGRIHTNIYTWYGGMGTVVWKYVVWRYGNVV